MHDASGECKDRIGGRATGEAIVGRSIKEKARPSFGTAPFMSEPRPGGTGLGRADTQAVLAEMERKRGYVLEFHRSLAAVDPEFLAVYDALISFTYLNERRLSKRDKELVYIAMLTALGADAAQLRVHMATAKDAGASLQEVLEVLEMCLPECGIPKFIRGIEAWRDLFEETPSESAAQTRRSDD